MKKERTLPFNLQFFAEGGTQPEGTATQEAGTTEEVAGGTEEANTEGTPNLEEVLGGFNTEDILNSPVLKKALQSRVDSTVTKALQTAKGKWEAEQQENLDESKKLEKMTAEQRAKYELEKERSSFEIQKKQFEHEQLVVSAGKELLTRNLDASFADFLTADTAEATAENINAFEQAFNNAVSNALNSRLKGTTPKDVSKNTGITKDSIKNMTTAEINANWEAVQEALKG